MKTNKISELHIIDADSSIFKSVRYCIPLYQRDYAWEEKQIVQLIEDIDDVKLGDNYYIGSLIVANHEGVYEVVDGQAMGIKLVKIEDLSEDIKAYMTTFDKKVGISDVADIVTVKNAIDEVDPNLCTEIERIYVSGEVTIKDSRDDCSAVAEAR